MLSVIAKNILLRRQGIVQMIPMDKQGNPVIEKDEDKDEESDD